MNMNLITNFLYNSIYQILIILLPLVTVPYVSRVIGAAGVGVYSYTSTLAGCFAVVGMLGVGNHGNRTIAACQTDRAKRSEAFWNIYAVQLSASSAVVLAYIVFLLTFSSKEFGVISFIQILTVAASLIDINWFFFGIEKFKLTVTRNIVIRLITVVLTFLFVKKSDDLWLYVLLLVGCHFVSNLVMWPFLRKYLDFVKPSFKEMRPHIKPMLVLFIPVIAVTIYNRMDKVMIGILSNTVENGYYLSAERIINAPMGIITALGTVMLPRMSYMYASDEEDRAGRYIKMSMDFACFMSIALVFGVAAIAKEFAPIFFGKNFPGVGNLIMLISPTILFKTWSNVIGTQHLIPLKNDWTIINSVWLGAVVNLIVNFLLISRWGAAGAIVGTLCAEGSVMLYRTLSVRKSLPVGSYVKTGLPYLVPGTIMFIIVRIIGRTMGVRPVTVIVEIFVGALVYLTICAPFLYRRYERIVHNIVRGW